MNAMSCDVPGNVVNIVDVIDDVDNMDNVNDVDDVDIGDNMGDMYNILVTC